MTPTLENKLTIADRISSISVSSTMKVMADADKLRREGVDVVDFSAGEPDFPTPDNIKQAAIRAINENYSKYTPAGGSVEARQAAVNRHKAEFGTDYKLSECIVSVGGKHVLFNYTQALVNPGDEVIIPVPYWVTYKDIVNYAGGKCVFVETDEQEGFRLTAAMIERNITPRTKIVLINSPSNPAGSVMEDAEFEKLYHITAKQGIFLLTDECYSHFLYDGRPYSVASIPGSKSTVLVAGTVSKTYAMTGGAYRPRYPRPSPSSAPCSSCKATPLRTRPPLRKRRPSKLSMALRIRCRRCSPNTEGVAISSSRACAKCRAWNAPCRLARFTRTRTCAARSTAAASGRRSNSPTACSKRLMWPSCRAKRSARTLMSEFPTPPR